MTGPPDEEWDDMPPGDMEAGGEDAPSPPAEEPTTPDKRDSFPEYAELPEGQGGKDKLVRLKDKTYPEKFGHKDKTHPVRLAAIQRAVEIFELRLKGWSLRELSHEFKVSAGFIHKILAREYDKIAKKAAESADHVRALMEERLDFMWKSLFPAMKAGNFRATEMGLKIMERQARLYGLDAPEKTQVDLNMTLSDSELIAQARRYGLPIPKELEALAGGLVLDAEFTVHDTTSTPTEAPEAPQATQEGESVGVPGEGLSDGGRPV